LRCNSRLGRSSGQAFQLAIASAAFVIQEGTIILFGSFAKGQTNERSDIDLFVVTEKKLDRSIFMKAGNLVGREASVESSTRRQFLKGLENGDPLVREVVSNHIVLKGIDEFCDIMWRYYARK